MATRKFGMSFVGSLFAIVALSANACGPNQCPRNPVVDPDAGFDDVMPPAPDAEVQGTAPKCARACKRLGADDMQCPEALGFPGGKSCAAVCTETQGTPFALKVDCVLAAKSVKEVQTICHLRCIKE